MAKVVSDREDIPRAIQIFACYDYNNETDRDTKILKELEKHLGDLRRKGLINVWYQDKVQPGTEINKAIDEHFEDADIFLLMVSPDFIASDFCHALMNKAIKKHDFSQAQILQIYLRPVDWPDMRKSQIQVLPTNDQPITLWLDRDEALKNVAEGIRSLVESLLRKRVKYWKQWSNYLYCRHKYDEALSLYNLITTFDPTDAKSLWNKGNALLNLKRYNEAHEAYKLAAEIEPNNPVIHCGLGLTFHLLGRSNSARDAYRKVRGIQTFRW